MTSEQFAEAQRLMEGAAKAVEADRPPAKLPGSPCFSAAGLRRFSLPVPLA
jgi:hypothetical protein